MPGDMSEDDYQKLLSLGVPKEAIRYTCEALEAPSLWEYFVLSGRWVPFSVCSLVLLLFLVIYSFHFYWHRLQKTRVERSAILATSEGMGVNIARRFLPSCAVNPYCFRGMRQKTRTISVRFEDLGLRLQDGRSVLDGVTGSFSPKRMAAIMGPSGAGKTTFMNVLCGKATYGTMTGEVWFNEERADVATLKPDMGFVPQDDVVHEQLTVRENFHFAAQLRNSPGTSTEQIDMIVEDVLSVMQVGHIQASIVGGVEERGISGGQRKRVNIGIELAACPTLLFLDEPTSGLDSTSSLQIINSLGKMTQLNMTIIMVIHQPRYPLFTLFNDVLLLGPGGRTVYLGPSEQAKEYFEGLSFSCPATENPADWFMDVLSGTVPNQKIKDFKPAMLTDLWKEKGAAVPKGSDEARGLTQLEDKAVLVKAIEDEWEKIDRDHSGLLDVDELGALLAMVGQHNPNKEAVTDLMVRIAGQGKLASKQDMVDYIHGLLGTLAVDKAVLSDGADVEASLAILDEVYSKMSLLSDGEQRAGRRVGCCRQYQILLTRRMAQFFRETRQRSTDVLLIMVCACGVGAMHCGDMSVDGEDLPSNLLIFYLGLSLLASTSCLRVFGADRPVFWRESASGMNVLAFYLARVWGNAFDLLLQCNIYAFVYFTFTRPPVAYICYLVPCLMISLASAGWGYLISVVVPPKNATLATVIFILISCGILGSPYKMRTMAKGGLSELALAFSLTRWAIPMTFVATLDQAGDNDDCIDPTLQIVRAGYDGAIRPWSLSAWGAGIAVLSMKAAVLFVLGYLGLRYTNRHKQV